MSLFKKSLTDDPLCLIVNPSRPFYVVYRPDLLDLSTNASVTEAIQWRSPVIFLSRQGGP